MRKYILILSIIMFIIFCIYSFSISQVYPERQINLIIPMAPGDGVDVAGRLMAEELSKILKVPIVVINKPGAGGWYRNRLCCKGKE